MEKEMMSMFNKQAQKMEQQAQKMEEIMHHLDKCKRPKREETAVRMMMMNLLNILYVYI
jgi:preprotein translocase subunit Sss1